MRKFFVLIAAVFCLTRNSEATVLPADKLLPDDTLVMFTLPDFNQVRSIYQNSPQGKFWNDPAMKDFKDKFMNKLASDYITPMEHDLGVHFSDYTNLPQGQVTVALIQDGWQNKEGQSAAVLLVIDTKDKSAQLTTNLADLKKKWVDAGKTVKTEKIRDLDFSVITLTTNDLPKSMKKPDAPLPPGTPEPFENPDKKNEPKRPLYIGQAESLLIVSDSAKVIEKMLVRMSGGSLKSLSEVGAFQANSGMFRDAPVYGWINSKALMDIMTKPADENAPAETNPFGFDTGKALGALGLNGLKTVAMNYIYTSEGAQFTVTLSVPEADRTGLFKILAGEAKDCNPPPFVPADAVKFQRWRIDGNKSWATLRKMLGDISPTAIGFVDFAIGSAEAAAKEKDPNFDLNKYLFANLGDDMITYQKNPKGESLAEIGSPPWIFLISSPNAEQLASALKSVLVLYSQQATSPTDREFLGHKIYSIPLPPTTAPDGTSTPRNLNYASSGGYLALTTDNAMIEEYLRSSENPPKALRDAPGMSDAAQKVTGPGTSLFGYANDSESMRVLFNVMKKDSAASGVMAALTPLTLAMGMEQVKTDDWLDLTLLPTFDKVSKYFYFSVYATSANADGLTFKAFAPVPPELKK